MRILVVEDEALVALEEETVLLGAGHEVVGIAADLASAVVESEQGNPDLALVDIQLARGSNGLQVAAALKERGIECLFVTGNCPTERGHGLALGCLHKPFDRHSLLSAVEVAEAVRAGRSPSHLPRSMHLYS